MALLLVAGSVLGLLSGCADANKSAVKTVSVTQTSQADISARPGKQATKARTFKNCDANIKAKIGTTSCGFANNTFYEYWISGESSSIRVYSPATGITYRTRCTTYTDPIVCKSGDGAIVKFSQASIDAYNQQAADAYAAKSDLGTSASSDRPDDGSSSGSGSSSNFCDTHDCIPNYPNGNGTTVQCADGTYSQSGGIQGACSHHGGVL